VTAEEADVAFALEDETLGEDEVGDDGDEEVWGDEGDYAGENGEEDATEQEDEDDIEEIFHEGFIRLVASLMPGRPPTVHFEYPPELEMKRKTDSFISNIPVETLRYKLYWERNCVKNCFARAGFKRTKTSCWNISWFKHPSPDQYRRLHPCQKVNHFPGSWVIGRKDRLLRLTSMMRRRHGSAYSFVPEGFILPNETEAFRKITSKQKGIWIMKPYASSCGRGIKLITNTTQIAKTKKCLVQRYIPDPFLLNGCKTDLRLYILVTSVEPLRIHLFNEGLTRICTTKYTLKPSSLKDRYCHLTNYSINRKSSNFTENSGTENNTEGNKWSLSALMRYLEKEGKDTKKLMTQIKAVITKTIIAAESEITPMVHRLMRSTSNCFELFGFDLMLDSKLKPWLIEVNISPSLMGSSPLDKMIKGVLMADVFHLVGVMPHDARKIKKMQKAERLSRVLGSGRRKTWGAGAGSGSRSNKRSLKDLDSTGLDGLTPEDWKIIHDHEDELSRCGNFECIFPTRQNVENFSKFFHCRRYSNVLMSLWLQRNTSKYPMPTPKPNANTNTCG